MYLPDYDIEQEEQVPFSIRVPPQMKEEIMRRCKDSTLSMARWSRKALLFALQNMDEPDIEQELDTKIRAIVDEIFEQKISSLMAVAESKQDYHKED